MADIEKNQAGVLPELSGRKFGVGEKFMSWRKPELVTGPGSIREIPGLLADAGVTKPMLVTGLQHRKDHRKAHHGAAGRGGIGFAVYSEVEANPSVVTAECIYMRYTENGCNGFIALGGGSPMDAAKAAAALCARPDKQLTQLAGLLKVGRPIPPIIAIPTTSGTRQRNHRGRRHHRQRNEPQIRHHGPAPHPALCHTLTRADARPAAQDNGDDGAWTPYPRRGGLPSAGPTIRARAYAMPKRPCRACLSTLKRSIITRTT